MLFNVNFGDFLLLFAVVGGWENEKTLIRRKRQNEDMIVEYTSNVLRKNEPLQLMIEITNGMCSAYVCSFEFHAYMENSRQIDSIH